MKGWRFSWSTGIRDECLNTFYRLIFLIFISNKAWIRIRIRIQLLPVCTKKLCRWTRIRVQKVKLYIKRKSFFRSCSFLGVGGFLNTLDVRYFLRSVLGEICYRYTFSTILGAGSAICLDSVPDPQH